MNGLKPWTKNTVEPSPAPNLFESNVKASVLYPPNQPPRMALSQSEYKEYLKQCTKNLEEGRLYEELAGNNHRKIVTVSPEEMEALAAFDDSCKGMSEQRKKSYYQLLMEDCREVAHKMREIDKHGICFCDREQVIIALVQGVLNMGIFEPDVQRANANANCTMDTPVEKLPRTSRVCLYHSDKLEFIYDNWLIYQPNWRDRYEIIIFH